MDVKTEIDKGGRPASPRTLPEESSPTGGPTIPTGSGPGSSSDTASPPSNHDPDEEYKALSETKPIWAVFLVIVGILMSLFLVALDRTIISTVRTSDDLTSPCRGRD